MTTIPHPVSAPDTPAAVELSNVSRCFDDRVVLDGIDLRIRAGEFVALIGRSGSGKSTLLRILAGLDRDAGGSVVTPGDAAVVFQEPRLLPWKRVRANVGIGLDRRGSRPAVEAALGEVGLAGHGDAWPRTLSGGEAQRVALARALVREPSLLLLDEPFGALDALTRLRMHTLVHRLVDEHQPATLLVTHDVDEAIALADRVLLLEDGHLTLDLPIDLDRPRRRDESFDHIRHHLLRRLGVELEG